MIQKTTTRSRQHPKQADLSHPINPLLENRWSPYAFSDRPVTAENIASLFEAARWAPSSYNEQPWRYIVATREDGEAFERLLSALAEPNREWARHAPVLALGIARKDYSRTGAANRHARHDLGQASANLTVEATARGLSVHQMGGILPDRARELYEIPDEYEAVTALAIGYVCDEPEDGDVLGDRDRAQRSRRPLTELVFGGRWGEPSDLITN